jgi:hypothetical protein
MFTFISEVILPAGPEFNKEMQDQFSRPVHELLSRLSMFYVKE